MDRSADLYLDLLKKILLNLIYQDPPLRGRRPFGLQARLDGLDWPRDAHTMIGQKRLDNLETVCRTVVTENVPGDFAECGVWRGGAAILMRAVLAALGDADRKVWLFDSFAGLPPPDPVNFPKDANLDLSVYPELAVSQERVQEHFYRYGLLDDRVVFTKGWFKDTLPVSPLKQVAVLRLDGDLYESTWQGLDYLYPRLSVGGFVIIDDYHSFTQCKDAVHDYRKAKAIDDEIVSIDASGVYWRRGK